jgi:hypothetical protein
LTPLKWLLLAALAYVGLVILFESTLGLFQPESGDTLVITTTDEDGTEHERVVSRLESEGRLYVAANHWPRAWYRKALENPSVRVTQGSVVGEYVAVPVSGEEHEQVNRDNPLGVPLRILTGFPPRYFLRLDPR